MPQVSQPMNRPAPQAPNETERVFTLSSRAAVTCRRRHEAQSATDQNSKRGLQAGCPMPTPTIRNSRDWFDPQDRHCDENAVVFKDVMISTGGPGARTRGGATPAPSPKRELSSQPRTFSDSYRDRHVPFDLALRHRRAVCRHYTNALRWAYHLFRVYSSLRRMGPSNTNSGSVSAAAGHSASHADLA